MNKRLRLVGLLLLMLSIIPLPIVAAQVGGPVDPYETGDDFDQAYGPLTLGPQYAAYLRNSYDADFYYFDVDQVGTIKVELGNVPDNFTYGLILYDKDKDIVDLDVQGKGNKSLSFDMSFSGRYYLLVDARTGGDIPNQPYLLRVYRIEPGSEQPPVNDSYEDNNTYQTAYGPAASGDTYHAYCWSQGDRDCYYFEVTTDSTVYLVLEEVCDTCDYDLYLVDENEEIVASSEQGLGSEESISANVGAGTYYVVVHPYRGYSQEDPYNLTIVYRALGETADDVVTSDSYEENNTYQTAWGPIESGQTYKAYCSSQGDRDCYYFSVSGNSSVQIDLKDICASCDYDLYLVNQQEDIIASSEKGQGSDEGFTANVTAGTYYVVVHPYLGYSQVEPYLLTVVVDEQKGPQPGNEGAWAQQQLEMLGYTVVYEPSIMDGTNDTLIGIAVEEPSSLDLRLEDDTTWQQAVDTWGILIQAFDVHSLAIGLTYQDRYMVYYALSSGDFASYMRGEMAREDVPYSYGIYDVQAGEWVDDAKDFIEKNFY